MQVSYVGMQTADVPVTDGFMTIKLENSNMLDEVITVAYGTAKRSAYTGAASVVDASVIEDRLVSNVTNALSGVVAGVQTLNSNGQPGTSSTVRIRGVGSINASMDPLYVLDGIPYDGDIASINPSDIEAMTVLKDAAAAALYGARGANGVILITTKRGKEGKAKVTLDARWGTNSRQVTNYDVIESPQQYLELTYAAQRNAAIYNLGYTPEQAHVYGNQMLFQSTGYNVFTAPAGEYLILPDGSFNPNATMGYSNGTNYFRPDNWADATFRNGMRQEYNLSVSGATDKLNYFISANYLEDEGVIDNSSYNRLSTRTSLEYQVNKWLKVGTNMSYSYSKSQYPDEQTATASSGNAFMIANSIAPIYPIYVRDASGAIMYNEHYGNKIYDYGDGKSTAYSRSFMSQANPAGQLIYDNEEYLVDLFNGKWFVQLTPIEGLTLTGSVGATIDNTRYHMTSNPLYGQFATTGGQTLQQDQRQSGLNLQGLANYTKTFNDVHTLDFLLGYESYEWHNEYVYAIGSNLYDPTDWTVNNTLANSKRKGYGAYGEYATRGIFGRINYDYDNTYFASVSYRRDASSRFHPDNRWGNFYSVSAAWNIANESFLHDQATWLDQLKLRASFGQQGNDGIGNNYAYLDQYTIQGEDSWSDGKLAYKGNRDLTWETSNAFNVGIDFSFWKGKLSGTAEYFSRQTSDMLYNKPTAPSLGYTSIPMNIGSMRNSGFEIELHYRPIVTKNITWEINGNATFIKNKVLELAPELNGKWISGSRYFREGESMYQLYMVKYAGVDKATGDPLFWGFNTDENGDKVPGSDFVTKEWKSAYRQSTGNLLPVVYGGLGTTLNAYGFDLGIACSYQLGGKIYDQGYQYFMGSGAESEYGHNWHKDILNAWTPENPNTDVPRLDASAPYSFYSYLCDRGLISSNYFAINNITFGYTLPASLTGKIGIETIRVYGAADNVALWSARKGLDPRQSYTTSTTSTYTALRCISGGIKVVF
ncbi:MAG: SusC/RagA family TonB-linked outer membrane protein [Duncaniella sp.]|nr:SusC/RagA family TonB-linked outer membrane protein [Duncaniella sp.]